ncbi:MAG: translation initiation factor IF-2, partial [Kiritimatiellia bacterium]
TRREKEEEEDRPEDLVPRPPVVTFLGHVDHGKTSLLDRIRRTSVAQQEHGGITQHIGAYSVETGGRIITFLDTPGHAAFTAMRARGANLTDIAVIVVAADDGVMPQTEEAIQHARAANVAIMVALNKIDLPTANPERVKSQLQALGLTPEEWGGETICVPVSALTGQGVEHLLEMILLLADMLELKANPHRRAQGFVVEGQQEPGMGPSATLLVKRGTLRVGDTILCAHYVGKVRALINDQGVKVKSAGPSIPVRCLGLPGIPPAGSEFRVYADERLARELAAKRAEELRAQQLAVPRKASLEALFEQLREKEKLELNLIVKADTQGTAEAVTNSLRQIKSEKVSLNIILTGVGNITENDVMLASASNAIVLGFHVGKEAGAESMARHEGVEIRLHTIIYELLDEVRNAMAGLLAPKIEERVLGRATVKQIFSLGKKGKVAGCVVTEGVVTLGARVRVKRGKEVLHEGHIESLRRHKDDVSEVRAPLECGIRLSRSMDFDVNDVLECYEVTEVKQTL